MKRVMVAAALIAAFGLPARAGHLSGRDRTNQE